jgi:hypothetical protein
MRKVPTHNPSSGLNDVESASPAIRLKGRESMTRTDKASSILSKRCTRPRRRSTCPLKFAFEPLGLLLKLLFAIVNGHPGCSAAG